MINLRPYQLDAINLCANGFKNNLRQILVMPTGAGKTVVFSEITYRAVNKGTTVLVLTDRTELFKQANKAIGKNDIAVCKISPDNRILHKESKLFVGMVETVARRLKQLEHLKALGSDLLIIIDECHKGNFFKIIDEYPEARVLGFTATPKNKHLHKYYTNLIDVVGIEKLIEDDFLTPCHPFQMEDDFSDVKLQKSGEDYNEQALFLHYNKSKLYAGVVEEYLKICKGLKTLVFNVNIEHSDSMAKAFTAAGIQSFSITSKTSDSERTYLLDQFSKGAFPVLNNCGILVAGYDEPTIEAIIVNRKTASLPLWLQMCGRGSRKIPDEVKHLYKPKNNFKLLDFGKNHDEHGLWDEPRVWKIEEPKRKKGGGCGAAPLKSCKQCKAVIPLMAAKCVYCGYVYDMTNMVLKDGVLKEVKALPRIPEQLVDRFIGDFSLDELKKLQDAKQHTAALIWRVVRSKGVEAVKEYAKMCDYKYGWVMSQCAEIEKENTGFTNYKIKQVIK